MARHVTHVAKLSAPLVVVCSLVVAHAAGLGGLVVGSLGVWSERAVVAAHVVVACDDVSRPAPTGAALAGRPVQAPAACGAHTWEIGRGTWAITGGRSRAQGSNSTAFLALGRVDVTAETVLSLEGSGANRAAGVVVNHSGSANHRYLTAVVTGTGNVELRLGNGPNNVSTLASAAGPPGIASGAEVRIRVTRSSATVLVEVNDVTVLHHALANSERSRLGTGSGVGWYDATGAGAFARLVVTEPW